MTDGAQIGGGSFHGLDSLRKDSGQRVSADEWNALVDWVKSITPYGAGVERSPLGTLLRIPAPVASRTTGRVVPLHILGDRPPYIPAPATPPTEGTRRYWLEWGVLNDQLATNWDADHQVSATTYFFAKATFAEADTLVVAEWEVVTGAAIDSEATPPWVIGEARPAYAVVLLGAVVVAGGSHSIVQAGGGGILLSEHITRIEPGSAYGETRIAKEITYRRLGY